MFPAAEPARHQALKVAALATGLGDMAVSLFYETKLHTATSEVLMTRRSVQIANVLKALDADRAGRKTDYWFGARIGHADIAVAAVLRFMADVHAGQISLADFPALRHMPHASRLCRRSRRSNSPSSRRRKAQRLCYSAAAFMA